MTTTMERVLTAELRMERERSRRLFDETQEFRRIIHDQQQEIDMLKASVGTQP